MLYLHNDGAHIRDFLNTVCGTMEEHFEKYEIVCVNDCCMDNTIEEIHRFLEESRGNHVVSMINLSFYQGVEMAMNAGRDLAVGDFLFEFDRCLPDFEPSLIMDVYYRALEGYDVVAAAPRRDVALTCGCSMQYIIWEAVIPISCVRRDSVSYSRRADSNRVNR